MRVDSGQFVQAVPSVGQMQWLVRVRTVRAEREVDHAAVLVLDGGSIKVFRPVSEECVWLHRPFQRAGGEYMQ